MTVVAPLALGDLESRLAGAIEALMAHDGLVDAAAMNTILRRFSTPTGVFSKSQLIRGFRLLKARRGWSDDAGFVASLRMKPVRTLSGVAPVTILTKPFPCPGRCIFCPSDVRMPKSYLSREPGAQRAAQHAFDPYAQTLGRLLSLHHTGHAVDKVELIILGGTWSFYPERYQRWFVCRAFDAMNDFAVASAASDGGRAVDLGHGPIDWQALAEEVDGCATAGGDYNRVVRRFLAAQAPASEAQAAESVPWPVLEAAQRINERAAARCVGLVVETRPDHLDQAEVERIRRLGATKVQIGFQSLDDGVLAQNHRGHDVAATRRAMRLLRAAGFKLHAHWMPNLYGSDPQRDRVDFRRIWENEDFRPDELKIYPCSLIESAQLMRYYRDGRWQPYDTETLTALLADCLAMVPAYCRVTRMIRDIPGDDIVTGNKTTNLRQVVEQRLAADGRRSRDIRAREIRSRAIGEAALRLAVEAYETSVGDERFLQLVTASGRLCGFLRLCLPRRPVDLAEIAGSAMIREVHVYGRLAALDAAGAGEARAQHRGLGRRLVEEAAEIATAGGFTDLAVISSVGTRDYYRGLGFHDGPLYQHRRLAGQARREVQ